MNLESSFQEDCEEFFDLIANEEKNEELSDAIDSLKEFIEQNIDGWTNLSEFQLARAVQCRLPDIWELISSEEKSKNHLLEEYYEEICAGLEEVTGYETDGDESA